MADDDKVVSALAKMVDDRLAAEFEKRDKMILNELLDQNKAPWRVWK